MIEQDLSGVILSGGKSRRMEGKDKAFIKLGSKTLLERTISRLIKQVDVIAVNTNSKDSRYQSCNLPILNDIKSGYLGPLAGILTGMKWGREVGYKNIVTVAVDTPFFPIDLVEKMNSKMLSGSAEIILARSFSDEKGEAVTHPTFGLWSVNLLEDLEKNLDRGIRKVLDWVFLHRVDYVEFFGTEIDPFFNINQVEDIKNLDKLKKKVI